MLVNMKEMLADAAKNGYAVGGFNCASLESAVAAIRASEETGIPFVLQPPARTRNTSRWKSPGRS